MPLTKQFGIIQSDNPAFLLKQEFNQKNLNHVKTLHASAIYSIAEITSGYFLKQEFPLYYDNTLSILRSSTILYKKACNSSLYSKAKLHNCTKKEIESQLLLKKKSLFTIKVKLYDDQNQLVVISNFVWFVAMK